MTVSLIILCSLIAVGIILYLQHRMSGDDTPEPAAMSVPEQKEEEQCCGMHITCEKDSLLAAVSKEIIYYDDDELDSYKGRVASEYSDEEIEQFRDVLLTLLPEDIAGWARSLQLRDINMPEMVREELLMIVSEERARNK